MLKGVCARLSDDGKQILLVKDERVLETLNLVVPKPEHRNFIISTWVKSYPRTLLGVSREVFNREEGKLAERLWSTGLAAVSGDDGFTVHGWVAGGSCLEHCYVVPDLRRIGVATCLIKAAGYHTSYARPLNKLKLPGWEYNPYRIR